MARMIGATVCRSAPHTTTLLMRTSSRFIQTVLKLLRCLTFRPPALASRSNYLARFTDNLIQRRYRGASRRPTGFGHSTKLTRTRNPPSAETHRSLDPSQGDGLTVGTPRLLTAARRNLAETEFIFATLLEIERDYIQTAGKLLLHPCL